MFSLNVLLQFVHKTRAAFRIAVAAVGERLYEASWRAPFFYNIDQCLEVVDVRVHAAVADEADEVDGFIIGFGIIDGCQQRFVVVQFAFAHGFIDACQFLPHDAAGADIEVTHFRVAHLAFGQAHVFAVRDEGTVRVLLHQTVEKGRICLIYSVCAVFWTESPAVEDEEKCFLCHVAFAEIVMIAKKRLTRVFCFGLG